MTGFGIRVTPKGIKTYVLKYVVPGKGQRNLTIGRHGNITPKYAREEAQRLKGEIASRGDPQLEKMGARKAITISDLCNQYLKEGCSHKKASTLATDRGRIKRHIKPLLGKKNVIDFSKNNVSQFYENVKNGKTSIDEKTKKHGRSRVTGGEGTARRTVGLLSGILSFAVNEGIIDVNPVHGVRRSTDKKNERYLTEPEISRLAATLKKAKNKGINIFPISAIRLLLLTGCIKGEIINLTWEEVDITNSCLRLKDSKTGSKDIPISKQAIEIFQTLPVITGCKYVFPGSSNKKPYQGLQKFWIKIRTAAELPDVRLHDLRHTFASTAASNGVPLAIIGNLLGHKDPKTTQRYAHIAHDSAKQATDQIAKLLTENMKF